MMESVVVLSKGITRNAIKEKRKGRNSRELGHRLDSVLIEPALILLLPFY